MPAKKAAEPDKNKKFNIHYFDKEDDFLDSESDFDTRAGALESANEFLDGSEDKGVYAIIFTATDRINQNSGTTLVPIK